MLKKVNELFFYFKIIALLFALALTMYIMFSLNAESAKSFSDFILVILPFTMTLLLFVLSFFFNKGKENIFYNISCIVAIIAIIIICTQTISNKNMIMWSKWQMNLYYFENQLMRIKIMLYLMSITNIILFIKKKKDNNEIQSMN